MARHRSPQALRRDGPRWLCDGGARAPLRVVLVPEGTRTAEKEKEQGPVLRDDPGDSEVGTSSDHTGRIPVQLSVCFFEPSTLYTYILRKHYVLAMTVCACSRDSSRRVDTD